MMGGASELGASQEGSSVLEVAVRNSEEQCEEQKECGREVGPPERTSGKEGSWGDKVSVGARR